MPKENGIPFVTRKDGSIETKGIESTLPGRCKNPPADELKKLIIESRGRSGLSKFAYKDTIIYLVRREDDGAFGLYFVKDEPDLKLVYSFLG